MAEKKTTKKDEKQRILDLMSITDPASDEYKEMQDRLNEFDKNKHKWDWSTIASTGIKGTLTIVGIGVICLIENSGKSFISQAGKFIKF